MKTEIALVAAATCFSLGQVTLAQIQFERVTTGDFPADVHQSFGCSWADFDNDGHLDLFVASASGQGNWLFRNTRDGQFEPLYEGVAVTDRAHSYGCATADFDHDGFLDLCVVNGGLDSAEANLLYRNLGGSNQWLLVRLIGTASNRSAIGAKLRVKATLWGEEVWQLRQVSGGVGAFSQDSLLVHIGLGDATQVDILRIEWPSGIVQEFRDVEAKRILTVTEPPRLTPQGIKALARFGYSPGSTSTSRSRHPRIWRAGRR